MAAKHCYHEHEERGYLWNICCWCGDKYSAGHVEDREDEHGPYEPHQTFTTSAAYEKKC